MRRHNFLLWTAIFAGPSVWFAALLAKFALSPWACAEHWKPALYVISVLALVLIAGAGFVARSQWHAVGEQMPGEGGGAVARSRLMAFGGLALSGFSILLLLAQVVAEVGLRACE